MKILILRGICSAWFLEHYLLKFVFSPREIYQGKIPVKYLLFAELIKIFYDSLLLKYIYIYTYTHIYVFILYINKSCHLEFFASLLIICSIMCSCSLCILQRGYFSLETPWSGGETYYPPYYGSQIFTYPRSLMINDTQI